MDRNEMILKVLEALNSNGKVSTEGDLGLDAQAYIKLLKSMQDDFLLSGFKFTKGGPIYWVEDVQIRTLGIQYLKTHKKVEMTEAHNRVMKYIFNSKFVSAKLIQDDVFGGNISEAEAQHLLIDIFMLDFVDDTFKHLTDKGKVYCVDNKL